MGLVGRFYKHLQPLRLGHKREVTLYNFDYEPGHLVMVQLKVCFFISQVHKISASN